ncbi:hypothetical protein ACF0H5_012670 [Mactra antiquata]
MSIHLCLQVALILCVYGSNNVDGLSCNSVKNCTTCVSKESWMKNCRWCSKTNSCHAFASLPNIMCPASKHCHNHRPSNVYGCNVPQGEYCPESAYINVLLSAVAYSDQPEECLHRLLPDNGFRLVAAIGRKCHGFLFKYKECFAAVAVSDNLKLIVVANRGTTSTKQLIEEGLETLICPKIPFKTGGEVQAYFYNAFDKIYSCVSGNVKDLLETHPDYTVAVTGHSLGGAIASLIAVSFVHDNIVSKDKMTLYTFGMPRVGDKTYAKSHNKLVKSSWRVVHSNDIVARLPTQTNKDPNNQPYHHKTEVYYPAEDMPHDASYKVCTVDEDPTCGNSNSDWNIDNHIYYFNFHVGEACSNIGARRKRSVDGEEISAMSDMFTDDTCKVIHFGDVTGEVRSGQNVIKISVHLILTMMVSLSYYINRIFECLD